MYRVRQIALDDKISEAMTLSVFEQVYPPQSIQAVLEEAASPSAKLRRVRVFTAKSVLCFLLAMALWTRLSQARVWDKLTHSLALLHPAGEQTAWVTAGALSYQRRLFGEEPLRALLAQRCSPVCSAKTPAAFYRGLRVMAVDGTLFNTADTPANEAAFERPSNQYGKGAYPQVRCVFLLECGSHAILDVALGGLRWSERQGAFALLSKLEEGMLLTHDAGLFSGGWWEAVHARGTQTLGALSSTVLLQVEERLSDGSYLTTLQPQKKALHPLSQPMRLRVIEYQITDERLGEPGKVYRLATSLLDEAQAPALELIVLYHERWEIELAIDEIKTHQRQQQKVLRSKTPEGVRQELYATLLAHYAVRTLMVQAAEQAGLDPDRLSFTEAVFQISEALDDGMLLVPEQPQGLCQRLLPRLCQRMLPPRRLRVNRREAKRAYSKYKPKKRNQAPPKPFAPHERFEEFVQILSRSAILPEEVRLEA